MFVNGMLTAAVLMAGVSSQALAQSNTEIVTGGGQTVVVPDAATESKGVSPVATEVVSQYPAFNQTMNNGSIAQTLVAQGFEDIHILREGSLMTITATRGNDDINLVYNLVEGRLIKVNGERILSEDERTPDNSGDATTAPVSGATAGASGSEDAAQDAPDDAANDAADDAAGDAGDGGTQDGGTGDTGTADGGSDDGDGGAGGDDGDSDAAGGDSDSGGGSEGDGGSDSDSSSGG